MQDVRFPWSDNWWIENDKAWFCAGEIGALFCVDMNSQECELIAWIPEGDIKVARAYSYCVKCKDIVFCVANLAHCIWCYDIKKESWEKIEVGNDNPLIMCANAYNKEKNLIWLLEDGIGKVHELDINRQIIERKHQHVCDKNIDFYEYTMVENSIYCAGEHKIFCISANNICTYEIDGMATELCTICYDGNNFWLSGYCKEIYIWNPKQGIVKVLNEFPKQFGFYHFSKGETPVVDCDSFHSIGFPFFINSIILNQYIWFIPFCSNEIVYINIEDYEIHLLDVEGEKETKESIEDHIMPHKYLLEYVREDRYIGVYSLKNAHIFEIDTIDLCISIRNYKLTDRAILSEMERIEGYNGQRVFKEGRKKDDIYYSTILKIENKNIENQSKKFGEIIYNLLK